MLNILFFSYFTEKNEIKIPILEVTNERCSTDSNSVILEKKPVKEFVISEVAGLQPATFLKLNSFSGIFTDFTTGSE